MMARTVTAGLAMTAMALGGDAIDLGGRRELFVDRFLVAEMTGEARLQLHRPTRREIVFRADAPWEGNGSGYQSVFRDGDRFCMYYRGGHHVASAAFETDKRSWETLCLAESTDGIHWTRPELGIVEFQGSKKNNLLLDGKMVSEFGGSPAHTATFKDTNPDCPASELYKIVIYGTKPRGLYLMVSADGIHFTPKSTKPFMTTGAFDSQNLAFWDPLRKEYRLYHRGFNKGVRDIFTCTAPDFESFPEPKWVTYAESPTMALYTNQIQPYYRAPHIFMGFPMRYNERGWSGPMLALPGLERRLARGKHHPRYGMTVTDAVFMTSRDGAVFNRWAEAFIRPGPRQKESWVYGDNFIFWGMYETPSAIEDAPDELSFLAIDGYWEDEDTAFRRYSMRVDGFASLTAPYAGGEVVTKPITFTGGSLSINAETSGFGSFQVEIQDVDGKPLPGFTLSECEPIFCDSLDYTVRWHTSNGGDLRALAGQPVRLRFLLKDADLYSFQFVPFRPAPERPGAPDLGILPPKDFDRKPFTVLKDDFQAGPASVSSAAENRLPATGDEDSGWVIRRGEDDRVRVLSDDPVGSGTPGPNHYLMATRKDEQMNAGGRAWVKLAPQDAADTTGGTMAVKARLHVPSTNRAAVDIDAFDSRLEEFQRRAFHVRFWPDGSVSFFKSITNKIEGLTFQPDTWFDVVIVADLAEGTFALTIGDQTVQDLPFAEEAIRRVQCIGFNPNTSKCTLYLDQVSITVEP
jgi:hypothetical protein